MSHDSRLSGTLHILLHMAEEPGPHTSDALAHAMKTNPVVVRRMMAGLRERGLVRAERGKGGGWTLACDCGRTTLEDIYCALGRPALFAMKNRDCAPVCVVEQSVNAALTDVFDAAEAFLLNRLGNITLADLRTSFRARLSGHNDILSLQTQHGP